MKPHFRALEQDDLLRPRLLDMIDARDAVGRPAAARRDRPLSGHAAQSDAFRRGDGATSSEAKSVTAPWPRPIRTAPSGVAAAIVSVRSRPGRRCVQGAGSTQTPAPELGCGQTVVIAGQQEPAQIAFTRDGAQGMPQGFGRGGGVPRHGNHYLEFALPNRALHVDAKRTTPARQWMQQAPFTGRSVCRPSLATDKPPYSTAVLHDHLPRAVAGTAGLHTARM